MSKMPHLHRLAGWEDLRFDDIGETRMDTIEAIRTRRSIRAYKPDPVPDDLLNEVIAAGFCAPSAHAKRAWHAIVVKDIEKRKQLAAIHPWSRLVKKAPVTVAVCVDRNESEVFWIEDGAVFIENMMLAAQSKGLGTCWIGIRGAIHREVESEAAAREILEIPDQIGILALVVIGYPAEEKPARELELPEGRVHKDSFGS